jgi:CheY-like chemotaxis protein
LTSCTNVSLLYVEDEILVQYDVEHALKGAGYEPILACNGEEALDLLERRSGEFGGLVTDVQLGGQATGWDVARRARQLLPNLPVIYASGGNGVAWFAQGVPHSVMIDKPFVSAQVAIAMATLLNAIAPATALA